jgi:hypothetical protein
MVFDVVCTDDLDIARHLDVDDEVVKNEGMWCGNGEEGGGKTTGRVSTYE